MGESSGNWGRGATAAGPEPPLRRGRRVSRQNTLAIADLFSSGGKKRSGKFSSKGRERGKGKEQIQSNHFLPFLFSPLQMCRDKAPAFVFSCSTSGQKEGLHCMDGGSAAVSFWVIDSFVRLSFLPWIPFCSSVYIPPAFLIRARGGGHSGDSPGRERKGEGKGEGGHWSRARS